MRTERQRVLRRAQKHRRRVKLAGAFGSFTPIEWDAIVVRQRGRCVDCRKRKLLTVDHIVPVSHGGCNFAFNIQGLCFSCNASKGAKLRTGTLSLFDGHRVAKEPIQRKPRVHRTIETGRPSRANPTLLSPGNKWARLCTEHTGHGCHACNRARWHARKPPPKPRTLKMPKVQVARSKKEPLCGVAIPKNLYELLRKEAFDRNVTMVSVLAEALIARYGVPT